jgi:hypothetical protein
MSSNIYKILVKVQPNAGRTELYEVKDGTWKIKIAAPAEKGKANKKLIEFLSDSLGVRKECITILKGETSHSKVLAVEGIDQTKATAVLSAICKKNT